MEQEQQTIFFKETAKLDLFGLGSENRLDLAKNHRLKLVANSNKYGIVAFGYNSVLKIFNTNEFESVSDNQVPNSIAVVNLQQGNKFVHIDFNKSQTHLIALVLNFKSEQNFEYCLNVYAMESIKVDACNSQQSPVLLNRIELEKDKSRISNFLVSIIEDDLVLYSKENGKIEIISKIMDQNFQTNSKAMDALCICWSPTGKNFAFCSKDKNLNLCGMNFEMKHKYECLEKDLEPNSIKWLAKKEFLVSYNDAENNPKIFYHEISKAQGASEENFTSEENDGVVFASGEPEDISWVDFQVIKNFDLIICGYSKSQEMGILSKKTQKYEVVYLEDFRPSLPMTCDDSDVFPIGIEISLNSQKKIDFDTRETQPPSPLLFCLADTGYLSTFYVINIKLKESICEPAEKLLYKQINSPILQEPKSNTVQFSKPAHNALPFQTTKTQAEFPIKPIEQQQVKPFQLQTQTQAPTITSKVEQAKENIPNIVSMSTPIQIPSKQIQLQTPKNLTEQPKENIPAQPFANVQSTFQLQTPKNLTEQPKENIPAQSFANVQSTFQLQTPTKPGIVPQELPKAEVKLVHPKEKEFVKKTEKIGDDILASFDREMLEFKESVAKLFDGKDLSKNLVDLKVTKQTKQSLETFNKLNDEMIQLDQQCSNTRSSLFNDFNNLEMLRLLKFNFENKKGISLIDQFDQDPFIKAKYENVKALYTQFDLELESFKGRSMYHRYETKFKNYREIYTNICTLDKIVTERTRKLNILMDRLKSSKYGMNVLHECNLNSPRKIKGEQKSDSILENIRKKGDLSMLSGKMSDLDLDKEIRQKCEKNSKLNYQLYNLLKKRKSVPKQTLNIGQLESIACKYIDSKSTQVPLNDTSFLHFNQASPNASRVLDSSVQQNAFSIKQKQEVHTPIQQKSQQSIFQLNQPKENETKILTTSTPTPLSSTPFFSGIAPMTTKQPSLPQPIQSKVDSTSLFNLNANPLVKQTEVKLDQTQTKTSQTTLTTSQSQPVIKTDSKEQKPKISEPLIENKQPPISFGQKATPSQIFKQPEAKETTKASDEAQKPSMEIPVAKIDQLKSDKQPEIQAKQDLSIPKSILNMPEPSKQVEFKSHIPKLDKALETTGKLPDTQKTQLFNPTSVVLAPAEPEKKIEQSKPKDQIPASQFKPALTEIKSQIPKINFDKQPQEQIFNKPLEFKEKDQTKQTFGLSTVQSEKNFEAKPIPNFITSFGQIDKQTNAKDDKDKQTIKTESTDSKNVDKSEKKAEQILTINLTKQDSIKEKNEDKKLETNFFDSNKTLFNIEEKSQSSDKFGFGSPITAPLAFNLNQTSKDKAEEKKEIETAKPAENSNKETKPTQLISLLGSEQKSANVPAVTKEPNKPLFGSFGTEQKSADAAQVTKEPNKSLFGTFGTEQKSADATVDSAKPASNLFSSFTSGESKPTSGNLFGSGFGQSQSSSIFGSKTESKPTFASNLASAKPDVNPFAAIASQKPTVAVETDADMDSSSGVISNNSLSFGGFGLGSSKPINEPTKNVFGGAQFASGFGAPKETPKSPFGGGIIKNATFSTSTQQTTTGFGVGSSTTTSSSIGGSLFGSFTSPNKPTFGAPPAFGGSPGFGQAASFGAPATFGGSSTFGSKATFGSASANAPAFGSTKSGNTASFGGFGQGTSNSETGFGALAAQSQNQSGSLFSSFSNNSGGFSNNASFTSYRK